MMTRSIRLAGLAIFVSTAALAMGSTAQANVLNFSQCSSAAVSQPFLPWGDSNYYELAPGGDGSLTGWSLQGGAQQVSGGETWDVSGTATNSLSVPAGGVAATPQTCVDAAYPSFRFFDVAGSPGSSALVSVVYGNWSIPVGLVVPGSSWAPSRSMLTLSAIPGLLNGGTANVQIQFTGLSGTVEIDDLYVDPWGKG